MNWYCEAAKDHPFHGPYHDKEYGFPLTNSNLLFERLCLEIFQAGLSWLTILKKKENFHRAFNGFDLATVAAYGETDRQRLLADAGIIRNRLKIDAIIENAKRILALEAEHGSFAAWIAAEKHVEWPFRLPWIANPPRRQLGQRVKFATHLSDLRLDLVWILRAAEAAIQSVNLHVEGVPLTAPHRVFRSVEP